MRGTPYPRDLTDEQWDLLTPVFKAHLKRGRRHADDLRSVVDAMLYGRTKGAKRVVAVDITGLPVAAVVVPASTHENRCSDLILEDLMLGDGVTDRLELVLVDRGVTAAAARNLSREHDVEVRRVGWDDKQPVFRPIRHAWRIEVAHGRLGRLRRLANSFENTTTSATGRLQVACIATTLRHLSRERARRVPDDLAA